jgi:ubiquinone biosynthesis protein
MLQLLQTWTPQEIETALMRPDGPDLRRHIGIWVGELLPVDRLVPDAYRQWRPLVRDSIAFVFSKLSPARLAAKITDQLKLPIDTPPEVRLIHSIRRMPGLQKLGQALARNRHLDPALRQELTTLENSIRDVEIGQILDIIERELGPALQAQAVEIEPHIFSEASVSAVVRFTYRGGRGIFKVLKPHIPDCFAEDMGLLQDLADFMVSGEHGYGFDEPRLAETFTEIRRLLENEVDFKREQASLSEAEHVLGSLRGISVPCVIPPLCTPVVTAMSEETGVKVTDLPEQIKSRHLIAEQLVEALLINPLFSPAEQALFHADPHAGNLIYDEQRRQVVLLDWALTARLSRDQRRLFSILILMLGLRDAAGVRAVIAELGEAHDSIEDTVRSFIEKLPLTRMPGIMDAVSLLDTLALKEVGFPAELLMFRKVLFTLDGVLRDVAGGDVSLDEMIAKYLGGRWATEAGQFPISLDPGDWAAILASVSFYSTRLWLTQLSQTTRL